MTATELQRSNWPLALVVGLPTLAVFELRGLLDSYQHYCQWLLDVGAPAALLQLHGYLLLVIGALLGARLASGRGEAFRWLGFARSCCRGLTVGVVMASPCLLLAAFLTDGPSFPGVGIAPLLIAPIAFEAFFRGLLVSIPVRLGQQLFWRTALLAGLLFGTISVPWGDALDWHSLADFCMMTAEGIWLAWLFRCYNWNLWVTIGVTAGMRVAWTIFQISDGAGFGVPWTDVGLGASLLVGTAMALRQSRETSQS